MALLRLNVRRLLTITVIITVLIALATLQIEHVFWHGRDYTKTVAETESQIPNRLAQYLANKLYNHRSKGDLDAIHYSYNESFAQKVWEQMVEYKKHVVKKGFYHKSDRCKATKAAKLWGDYQTGGILCEVYDLDAWQIHREIVENVIEAEITDAHDVTLVTHMTGDRITTLEKIVQHWNGPISVGIYAQNASSVARQWHQNPVLSQRRNIGVHVVVKRSDELFYPVNVMRNVALNQSITDYVFLTDADLVPTPNMDHIVKQYLPKHFRKQALIVPAFEVKGEIANYPQTKDDLLKDLHTNKIEPFLIKKYFSSYGPLHYTHWSEAQSPYKVTYEPGFEPYVIIAREHAPRYYEPLVGYYLNKISYILELQIAGFEFHVLPNVYTLHLPHPGKKSKSIKTHLMCVLRHFVSFLQNLETTYCVRFIPYAADLFS